MANVVTRLRPGHGAFTVLPSAARTAAPDTQEFEHRGARGLVVVVDATAVTGTPSVTVTVAGVDRVSGKTWTLLASAAITGTGTTVLKIGPGLTAAANAAVNDMLPPVFRVTCAHGDSDSITYSVTGHLCY